MQELLLRSLLSPSIGEHICAPPDAHSEWTTPAAAAGGCQRLRLSECGQHLATPAGTFGPSNGGAFAHSVAAGRSRSAGKPSHYSIKTSYFSASEGTGSSIALLAIPIDRCARASLYG
jgi:hypothetical protein